MALTCGWASPTVAGDETFQDAQKFEVLTSG